MREATAVMICPGCGKPGVVKNGHRDGEQRYMCQPGGCLIRFSDRTEAFGQRFPAEVIAGSIELHLQGMPYKKIAAEAGRRHSISDTVISESTVLRWVEKYVDFAVYECRKLTFKLHGPLSVEYASLHPAGGGCWLVRDLSTSCVLAARAGGSFDAAAARGIMVKSIESTGHLLGERIHFTFGTDEGSGDLDGLPDVLKAIKKPPPPFGRLLRAEKMGPDYFPFLSSATGAFQEPLRIMRNRKAFRSPGSRQRFLDGWVVAHNFFIRRDAPDGLTPAQKAGAEVPFRSWLDVVNHLVTAPKSGPVQRRAGLVNKSR